MLPVEGTRQPVHGQAGLRTPNDKNRISLRYDRTDRKDTNQSQISGSLDTEEVRYTFGGPIWNVVGSWTTTLGNTKFNEVRAVLRLQQAAHHLQQVGDGRRRQPGPGASRHLRRRRSTRGRPSAARSSPASRARRPSSSSTTSPSPPGATSSRPGSRPTRCGPIVDITNFHDGYWIFPNDIAFDIDNPDELPRPLQRQHWAGWTSRPTSGTATCTSRTPGR